MSRRDEILEQCLELFNAEGFIDPSLRSIANHLGMSDGNLRYHFKKKEDIILAIFAKIKSEIKKIIDIQRYSEEINEFKDGFRRLFEIMMKYRFFFVEYYYLTRKYPKLNEDLKKFNNMRKVMLTKRINEMRDQRILTNRFDDQQYKYLVDQIFIISQNWINSIDTFQKEEEMEELLNMSASILIPYLST